MTLIQGYTEAILDGIVRNKKEQEKYLRLIHDKTLILVNMTNDLFMLSQLESRQVKLNLQRVKLTSFIKSLDNKFRYDVESTGIVFNLNIPDIDDNTCINIDVNSISRVFSNLIYNALSHTSEGEISISCRLEDYRVLFIVADTGTGISENDLPYIFDRFYSASKSRNLSLKSNGLGLAIAKQIVEYHGGSIWVNSKLGHGSSFNFTIKRWLEDSQL